MARPIVRGSSTSANTPTAQAGQALDRDARRQELARQFLDTPDAPQAHANEAVIKQIRDSEKQAEGLKKKRLLQLKAEQEEREKLLAEAKAAGRPLAPILATSVDTLTDASLILDSDGKYAVEPGNIGRWVRLTDAQERDSMARASSFRQRGWKPCEDPKTGEPITSALGLAMQAPAAAVADYKALQEKDRIDMATLEDQFRSQVDQLNREFGATVARTFTPEREDLKREHAGEPIA